MSVAFAVTAVALLLLALVVAYDLTQTRHAIL